MSLRIGRDPRELFIDSLEEVATQAGTLSFVPLARGFELVANRYLPKPVSSGL